MARLGMDPEVVEKVGRDLQRQAAYLDAVIQQVDRLVSSGGGNWQGNKGRQFVADWQSHHRTAVVHCADSVRGLGQSALNNAQAQRGVSGSPGGAAGSGGVGGVAPAVNPHTQTMDQMSPHAKGAEGVLGTSNEMFTKGKGGIFRVVGGGLHAYQGISDIATGKGDANSWAQVGGGVISIAGNATVGPILEGSTKVWTTWTDPDLSGGERFWGTVDGVWTGGGAVPVVGAVQAAWDAGTWIGTGISNIPIMKEGISIRQDQALAAGAEAVGGDPSTDPVAAARLVERHEGIGGFFNLIRDSAVGAFRG